MKIYKFNGKEYKRESELRQEIWKQSHKAFGKPQNAEMWKRLGVEVEERSENDVPQSEKNANDLLKRKHERKVAVQGISVQFDGLTFHGDEKSQSRMARYVLALEPWDSVDWVMFDGTVECVTASQLKTALRLACLAQSELWSIPYKEASHVEQESTPND